MSELKTCEKCVWARRRGPHLGCYHEGMWQRWIPKNGGIGEFCQYFEETKK